MIKQFLPLSSKSFFAYEYFLNRPHPKLATAQGVKGDAGSSRTATYINVREDSSAVSLSKSPVEVEFEKNILLVYATEEDTIEAYKQLLFFSNNSNNILYFPSLDTIPYDRISPNQNILSERAKILSRLATDSSRKLLVTNAVNLLSKLPPPEYLAKSFLKLHCKMKFTASLLAAFLVHNSYTRSASAIDSGEFSVRGEIIDIVLPGNQGYRINFSWDHIESIREFDIDSQISVGNCEELIINSASEVILNPETINNFRNNYLKSFGVNYTKIPLYESIIEGRKFQGYEHLSTLFYNSSNSLTDYLNHPVIIYDNLSLQAIIEKENNYLDLYNSRVESNKIKLNNFYPALSPQAIYYTNEQVQDLLNQDNTILVMPENSDYARSLEKITTTSFIENKTVFDKLFEILEGNKKKIPIIFCQSKSNVERFKNIISNYSRESFEIENFSDAKANMINLVSTPLDQGFYSSKYLFIAAADLLGEKQASRPKSATRALKNILMELDNLNEGELIVHKDHGIGQFLGVEALDIKGKAHDFLKLLYLNNDKLYIPVENIDVIKKYGSNEAELSKLGSVNWQKNKAKLKNRITEIAQQLLEITAKRKVARIHPIEFNSEEYEEFCRRFKYTETEDQLNAINDIRKDLDSEFLMDRLICGDVGFGKTEVAIRAAFMVAKANNYDDRPQVAIVVPTTILCKQHYLRFLKRFKDLGLKIVQLSSLVTNSEAKVVKEQIGSGEASIIIGTHALLSKTIKFYNLKLLIIDEEQHFGVGQKEYLKSLRSSMHVLSLSATPIPRTLQMSMVGLKDLSIIATPPMDRLEVRTIVTPFDEVIIRDALLKERFRGGRSFYVVPRIKDIPDIERYLQTKIPELKYKVAHGQMAPSKIDEIMSEFCDGKFDILVATTIIESGIDIAEANTMIIHKSDSLGLSQLYQLRGRIGRSKVRGYAYLTLSNYKKMTSHSIRRLEIMQNSCALGSGFTIASHDMDLRGFGNLVGEEQSGQIKEVGVELYQEMLDEQISLLKNEPINDSKDFVPVINLGLSIFIPDSYVTDSSLKLSLYRRVGSLTDDNDVENFKDEMVDRFGSIPIEFNNLLDIVKIKHKCSKLAIENLDAGDKGFVIKFYKESNVADVVSKFVMKYPGQTKIKPDNKLIYIKKLVDVDIIKEANDLLDKLGEGG